MRHPSRPRGFTLLELIVVIVVIGILAAIATVGYASVTSKSTTEAAARSAEVVSREALALAAFDNVPASDAYYETVTTTDASGNVSFDPATDALTVVLAGTTCTVHYTNLATGDHDPASCGQPGSTPPSTTPPTTQPGGDNTIAQVIGLAAVPGDAQVTLSWTALAAPTTATGYRVYVGTALGCQAAAASTTCTVTGLTNGTQYTFFVVGYNTQTEGPASLSVTATPFAAADAPTNLAATAGNTQISYAWTALTSTAAKPVTGYRVYIDGGSGAVLGCQVAGASSTTCSATGLTNGTSYSANAVAYYDSTEGAASNTATATPFAAADAPSNFTATATNAQISYSWSALLSTAAKPVSGYRVYLNSGSGAVLGCQVGGASNTNCTATGLTNGTEYTANVVAYYSSTEGSASTAATATPFARANGPSNFTATAGNTQITYSWTALTSTATKPIAGYRVYVNSGSGAVLGCQVLGASSTTCTATGLTNGTTYSANVVAYYDSVEGFASSSASATPAVPATAPSTPSALTRTATGTTSIGLSWTAPAANGAAITDYLVEYSTDNATWLTFADATSSATTATVTGLDSASVYYFHVAAKNSAGTSSWSSSLSATTATTVASAGWGENGAGQIGDGSAVASVTPVSMSAAGLLAGKTVTQIALSPHAGTTVNHACAAADAQAYCWGYGANGRLGDGLSTNSLSPVLVSGLAGKTVTAVTVGYNHSCAIADGGAYCWGFNSSGQLGIGSTTQQATAVPVSTSGVLSGKSVTTISAGNNFTCAIADGGAYCWGADGSYQLGDMSSGVSSRTSPVAVTGLTGTTVTAISAGGTHACVVADAAAYCWGSDASNWGVKGSSATGWTARPVTSTAGTPLYGRTVTSISAGRTLTCAIADGAAYCWGYNSSGRLGDGTTTDRYVPTAVDTSGVLRNKTITSISAGNYNTAAA